MGTWCFQVLGSVWGGKRLHKQSTTEKKQLLIISMSCTASVFCKIKKIIFHGGSSLKKNTPASVCAAWRTQLNGDKLVVSHRRFTHRAAGCLQACAPWIRAAVCLVFLAESYRDTRGGEMFPRRVLQTFSWRLSAIERTRPRSSEKRSRPFAASRVCIVSDKDTLLHCSAGRGLRSSGGWMKGGSAQARTQRSGTSKTDPKRGEKKGLK